MSLSPARRQLLLPGITLVLSVMLLSAAAWMTIGQRDTGAPAPSAIGGPFQLTDMNGATVTQDTFKGKVTLIFFGFTHCPEVCPTTLLELSEIMRKIGPAEKLQGLFVTVDPERDTPELMKSYLASFDKRITGLTGDASAVETMLREWRVYWKKIPLEGGDYTMDHTAIVYLMDRQMRFVNAVPLQDTTRAIQEIRRWM